MSIINGLRSSLLLVGKSSEKDFEHEFGKHKYRDVHFGCYDDRPLQPGDLVLAQTGPVDDFKVAWVYQVVSESNCILREIGSSHLCNYSNETFKRIVGMDKELLLEGDRYLFRVKVLKAFKRGGDYSYRYGDVEFHNERIVEIWIRESFGGWDGESIPFSFKMKWNKKTSIKKILETMIENGYGTRKFETNQGEQDGNNEDHK